MEKQSEEKLVSILREKRLTITTAESCTGGMISSAIVNVPGASWVLNEAYITYSNEAKMKLLGVKAETLEGHGAVSEETALEMVKGAAAAAMADAAIAVTGIAGPDGGTVEKPVGTVYAGFYYKGKTIVERFNLDGDRLTVRRKTTEKAVNKMVNMILDEEKSEKC